MIYLRGIFFRRQSPHWSWFLSEFRHISSRFCCVDNWFDSMKGSFIRTGAKCARTSHCVISLLRICSISWFQNEFVFVFWPFPPSSFKSSILFVIFDNSLTSWTSEIFAHISEVSSNNIMLFMINYSAVVPATWLWRFIKRNDIDVTAFFNKFDITTFYSGLHFHSYSSLWRSIVLLYRSGVFF